MKKKNERHRNLSRTMETEHFKCPKKTRNNVTVVYVLQTRGNRLLATLAGPHKF